MEGVKKISHLIETISYDLWFRTMWKKGEKTESYNHAIV